MNILVVGNIVKDVYLNLDTRTEHLETDKHHTKWLNLGFNASEHRFFNRESSIGGAAVTLETLQKLGLDAAISGTDPEQSSHSSSTSHRYILIADDQTAYLAPSRFQDTPFVTPATSVDYLYIDRSAELSSKTAKKITAYLHDFPNTKLIIYLRNLNNPSLNSLLPRATLIFAEGYHGKSELAAIPELRDIDASKFIFISDTRFSYLKIVEPISTNRIDIRTHLSAYSTASATILGSFILGYSVEDSLQLAHLNLRHSKINSTLTLDQLQELAANQSPGDNLELTAASLVLHPKGILAADESGGSIQKKFAQLDIPDTYNSRRDYRNIFFTTPDLEQYVNGVILFDETAHQHADNGQTFVDYLTAKRIIPGIKVDQGLADLPGSNNEKFTKGLKGLEGRLREYYQMGLRFAKWRAAFNVQLDADGHVITPSDRAIERNCDILAEYAHTCQSAGLVPVVEPELVYDGDYDIDTAADLTGRILDRLFESLNAHHVNLRACILKVNMVLAGKQQAHQSTPDEVGAKTARVLKRHVPKDLAGVVFLSGGQTPEQATTNLAAIKEHSPFPWPVTFSFARALQDPALYAWQGDNTNADAARAAFLERLQENSEALEQK